VITRRQFLKTTAAGAIGLAGGGFYTWRIEPHWVEIVRRDLPVRLLPEGLAGKSLVQISDLHVGPQVDDDYLVETLEKVRSLHPDILVVTGDFITYRSPGVLVQAQRVLRHLPRGRLATLGVTGNHDYGPGWSHLEISDRVAGIAGESGLDLLRNEIREVAGLQVAGLDDFWGPRFRPARVLSDLDSSRASLVLCHNPDAADVPVWRNFRGWILAGHTHGGQCRPPFLPPLMLPVINRRYTAGEFRLEGGRMMYINRGIGHLLPVRFNVRPEITFFRLVPAPERAA
jgi:predicted MPP superfamily phosphohydrolase